MAGEYQFGIDDAKVEAWSGGTLSGTMVDVLGVSSFGLSLEGDSVEHRGDNQLLRIRRTGKRVTGSVEQAATNLATYAVIGDGEVTTSGTTPNEVTTYTEPSEIGSGQYQLVVQAADVEGATRFTVLKATTTGGPNFDWSEGEFSNPSWDYEGSDSDGDLFLIEQYETEEAIGV